MPIHAQVDGIGTLEFPDGTDPAVIQATVKKQIAAKGQAAAPPPPAQSSTAANVAGGIAEPVLNMASGAVGSVAGGLAGLGAMATKALGVTNRDPAEVVGGVQSALTYQPRTQGGQAVSGVINYIPQKIGEFADYAGGKVADTTGSPALGAGVNTAIQAAPAVLLHRAIGGSARASAAPIDDAAATAAAKAYVARTPGLDWNALSDGVKAKIADIAKQGGDLSKLDPQAVARQANLESLPAPVPATKGQLTRDPVQLRNEASAASTQTGQPIRDIHVAQNKALLDNLNILKTDVSGSGPTAATAVNPEQVGASVQEAARAKLDAHKAMVSDLYDKARANGELQAKVSVQPIIDVIAQTPDKTHFGYVQSWLNKMDAVGTDTKPADFSVNELEDLRKAAVAKASNGGEDAYYAGKVINAIDAATSNAGGAAYQAARAARKAQALEFQDQGGVANLVDMNSRTDRSVALENTWKTTVLNGSIQDLRNVKQTLMTGGTPKTQALGAKAWNDIRAQTIQYITDQATKGVSRYEDGTPSVTPAAMQRAIQAVGPQKLEEIFGSGTVARLNQIMKATGDVKTEPPPSFKGSPTFANAIAFLEKSLGKIPVLGDTVTGAVRGVSALRKMGQVGRDVNEAQQTPLGKGLQDAKADALKQHRRNALNALYPATSATQTNALNQN